MWIACKKFYSTFKIYNIYMLVHSWDVYIHHLSVCYSFCVSFESNFNT